MSLEVNNQPEASSQFLAPDEEAQIVKQLCEIWTKGEEALAPTRDRKKRLKRAYDCQHDSKTLKQYELRKGSKGYLPLIYTAHESAHARLMSSLMPNDEDLFAFMGETPDDQAGCDVMGEYLKVQLKRMDFAGALDDTIKEILFGDVVLKVYWRKDTQQHTVMGTVQATGEDGEPLFDEFGQPVTKEAPVQESITVYNGAYCEVITGDDFIIYPVTGDRSRVACAHRVWRHKDELLAVQETGKYVNVDRVEGQGNRPTDQTGKDSHHQGHEVKEFWISRIKVNDKVYKNIIATMVDDKTLVRFERNNYDYGLIPFIYCPFIKDHSRITGHGLTDKAYQLQKMSNFVINQVFDEAKIKLYGIYKYTEDSVFNPGLFVSRPGALVKVGDMNNLQPLNPNIGQLSFGITELQYLESQFEVVTGVPKFLKGINDQDTVDETATAKRLAAEGSDSRFRGYARRINEYAIKPALEMMYSLTRQMAMQDPEVLLDIARTTQERFAEQIDPATGETQRIELPDEALIQKLPHIPALPNVDVNVVAFENVLNKAEKAGQIERFMGSVSQIGQVYPELIERVKPDDMLDSYARSLGIDSEMIRTDQEMVKLQQAKMQAQEEMAQRLGADPRMLALMGGQNGQEQTQRIAA